MENLLLASPLVGAGVCGLIALYHYIRWTRPSIYSAGKLDRAFGFNPNPKKTKSKLYMKGYTG